MAEEFGGLDSTAKQRLLPLAVNENENEKTRKKRCKTKRSQKDVRLTIRMVWGTWYIVGTETKALGHGDGVGHDALKAGFEKTCGFRQKPVEKRGW